LPERRFRRLSPAGRRGRLRKNAQEPGQLSDDTVSYTYVVRIAIEVENE
jgi:hypothetical protein